jgi:tRNA-splicing ligase RtcB
MGKPLSDKVTKALLRLARAEGVMQIAVMPDVHLAQGVCIGMVFSAEGRIFPEAVGNDIGCGMAAIRLNADVHIFYDNRVPLNRPSSTIAVPWSFS